MSIDIAIQNIGEYYAAQYLTDKNGFIKDIADQDKTWKDQGSQSAPRKLAALGESYFKAKSAAMDYDSPELRQKSNERILSGWHVEVLQALGYMSETGNVELPSEKSVIPALSL